MKRLPPYVFGLAMLVPAASARAVIKGDVNGDHLRNGADIHPFVAVMTGLDSDPQHRAAADFDCDGIVNATDAAALINVIMNGAADAPVEGGSAIILGKVLDTNGQPLAGAQITAVFYPGQVGGPPLPPMAFSGADGSFQYNTVCFEGSARFIVQIRKLNCAENLRDVTVMPGRCWRVDDAVLNPVNPPVQVPAGGGGTVTDAAGGVSVVFPPGALTANAPIRVTKLATALAVRAPLPQLVSNATTIVDIGGVPGEATNSACTVRVPNTYNLPIGTKIRFGKLDHNTLQWQDLHDGFPAGTANNIGEGEVVSDGQGGTRIEVEIEHFCSCTAGYCLPVPDGDGDDDSDDDDGDDNDDDSCGDSVINHREGHLWEDIKIPTFTEMGQPWGVSLGYASYAASPSVTLSSKINYNSNRPIERTMFEFSIEGVNVTAHYGASSNNQKHHGTYIWNGRDGMGHLMPTGSYAYTSSATSFNANLPVAISSTFGGSASQTFSATYPGLMLQRIAVPSGRVVLINQVASPCGAGWTIGQQQRLYFDPDGGVLLTLGNSDWRRFVPTAPAANTYTSPASDFSTFVRNASDGTYSRTMKDGTRYDFDSIGRQLRKVTRYGHTTSYQYDGDLLTRITSPTGYYYDFAYTSGKLTGITDGAGRHTGVQVNAAGDMVSVTLPDGSVRSFNYNSDHLLTSQVGPRGERSEYDFDTGRVKEARSYDIDGATLLRRRQFAPSAVKGEIGKSMAAGQGSYNNPIAVVSDRVDGYTDGRGVAISSETDGSGNTTRRTDGLGRVTQYAYNTNKQITSRTRADNSVTQYSYDAQGNRTGTLEVFDSSTASAEYNGPFQQLSRYTNQLGHQTNYTYLADGALSSIQRPEDNTTTYFYDDPNFPNLVTRIVDTLNHTITNTYDSHGNKTSVADALNRTTQITYDAYGNLASRTDPMQHATHYTYDAHNHLVSILDAANGLTQFSYQDGACACSAGNPTQITLPSGATLRNTYDALNHRLTNTDQLGHTTHYDYDAEGHLTGLVNRNGERITYTYDFADELIRKELPGGDITTFTYDSIGNVTVASNATAELHYSYDPRGRVTAAQTNFLRSDIASVPITIQYTYDLSGNRTSMQTPGGLTTYGHDAFDRITTVADPAFGTWSFIYDGLYQRELHLPNATKSTITYDAAGQITQITHGAETGAIQLSLEYQNYDGAGNLTALIRTDESGVKQFSYAYDSLKRLISTEQPEVTGEALLTAAPSYDAANRLLADGEATYQYDDEGRRTSRDDIASVIHTSYEYDAETRLRRVAQHLNGPGGITVLDAEYAYDPVGRRALRKVNGVVSAYVYDGSNILVEISDVGAISRRYAGLAVDRPLAVSDELSGQKRYYHVDHLGSLVAFSNEAGVIAQGYRYDSFGELFGDTDVSLFQPFTFTSRERDWETGLYYYRSRYYDAAGRFLSEDLLQLASGDTNFYGYVGQNPSTHTDPSGMAALDCNKGYEECKIKAKSLSE